MERNDLQTSSNDPEHEEVVGRIRRIALASSLLLAGGMWVIYELSAALALICSAVLMIMNFFWLEEIILATLQPKPDVNPFYVGGRIILRLGLIAISAIVTIVVARFEPVAVLLGFSVIVIGICGEAFYSLIRTLKKEKKEKEKEGLPVATDAEARD